MHEVRIPHRIPRSHENNKSKVRIRSRYKNNSKGVVRNLE